VARSRVWHRGSGVYVAVTVRSGVVSLCGRAMHARGAGVWLDRGEEGAAWLSWVVLDEEGGRGGEGGGGGGDVAY